MKIGISKLWNSLCKEIYQNIDDRFISNFRSPKKNLNRFTTNRQPKEQTYRYYLTILFNEARKQNKKFYKNYKKLGDTNLGQPLYIFINGLKINFDYLNSLYEYNFISENMKLNKIVNIVEVGGGFGRTAHTLLKLHPSIKKYTIIDLPKILEVSNKYLQKVLPSEIKKINFISVYDLNKLEKIKVDLAINIDSFQEMPEQTIYKFLHNLFAKANYAYIKNPVCKYNPKLLGIESPKKFDIFSLGLMKQVRNIYDETELIKMRKIFNKKYCPSKMHKILDAKPCNLYSYYQNVLYKKS
jgi:putative sugar O-methyltransferase